MHFDSFSLITLLYKLFSFLKDLFILAMLGHCWEGFSMVVLSGSYPLIVMRALLITVTSLVARAWALSAWASVAAVPRL